ncbi:MAG TPA: polysaccharide deacetylase family protein [Verrucomicrobiae bacterium]|nr:polysaccharide deacetylase family protein [Verrucomicrobiae bacterium]
MMPTDLPQRYHWNYRPRSPERPVWFTQWPDGNRIAVTINIMHEWESAPRSDTIQKRAMTPGSSYLDFLALGAREYGANFGFCRLLDVLDRFHVKATVLTSGLMAELFPATLKEATRRGHEVACHHWDQSKHPFDYADAEEEREAIARSIEAIEKSDRDSPLRLHVAGTASESLHSGDLCLSRVPVERGLLRLGRAVPHQRER